MVTTVDQYFGTRLCHPQATLEKYEYAVVLVSCVNDLIEEFECETGYEVGIDPDTGTQISGSRGGSGDGGFRLSQSRTGVSKSSHKEGRGIDIYDPRGHFGRWIRTRHLVKYDLYQEAMKYTPGWVHLQTRPASIRIYRPY